MGKKYRHMISELVPGSSERFVLYEGVGRSRVGPRASGAIRTSGKGSDMPGFFASNVDAFSTTRGA